jgi:2-hydroxychromene-2-carboxylate isomerase
VTKRLHFWFEFASTYSYPAAMRIEAVARAREVTIEWRPFLLGPILAAQGMAGTPFNLYPVRGRYMVRDVQRTCVALDLPFELPKPFPQNGLLCARIATALEDPLCARFARAVYTLEFGGGRTISDPLTAAEALRRAGLDTALVERAQDEDVKARLRASTDEATALGIFGAPTFVTPDKEMFWGNDRLEQALDWTVKGQL